MAVKVSTSPSVTGLGVATNVNVVEIGRRSKVAVTALTASMVTVQLPAPLQAPDQLVKDESLSAVAVKVRIVPGSRVAVQVRPQSMAAGTLVMLPLPSPVLLTVSVYGSILVSVKSTGVMTPLAVAVTT